MEFSQRDGERERDTIKITASDFSDLLFDFLCVIVARWTRNIYSKSDFQSYYVRFACMCVCVYTPIEATNRFFVYILMLPNSREFTLSAHIDTHLYTEQKRGRGRDTLPQNLKPRIIITKSATESMLMS